VERKLAAILCADVFGYSRLMGENEEATIRTLSAHRKIMSEMPRSIGVENNRPSSSEGRFLELEEIPDFVGEVFSTASNIDPFFVSRIATWLFHENTSYLEVHVRSVRATKPVVSAR
jgi:hypothetical protein